MKAYYPDHNVSQHCSTSIITGPLSAALLTCTVRVSYCFFVISHISSYIIFMGKHWNHRGHIVPWELEVIRFDSRLGGWCLFHDSRTHQSIKASHLNGQTLIFFLIRSYYMNVQVILYILVLCSLLIYIYYLCIINNHQIFLLSCLLHLFTIWIPHHCLPREW